MMALRERHRANQVLAAVGRDGAGRRMGGADLQGAGVAGRQLLGGVRPSRARRPRRSRPPASVASSAAASTSPRGSRCWSRWPTRPHPGRRVALALAVPAAVAGHLGAGGAGHLRPRRRSRPRRAGGRLDAAHVAAAAVWAGGLLQLAWVTPHATRGLAGAQRARVRSDDRPPVLADRPVVGGRLVGDAVCCGRSGS